MRNKTVGGDVRRYARAFRRVLEYVGADDVGLCVRAYVDRLVAMYASEAYVRHSVYPTTDATHVFAVIAMCLELKDMGLADSAIICAVNEGFASRRAFFARLIRLIDRLPLAYRIVHAWNVADHRKRVADGSITYDTFEVSEHRISYQISRCAYVEMFSAYGIRSLCKVFCMTDETAYANLMRHVTFRRYSDLSDGSCCHDIIFDRRFWER